MLSTFTITLVVAKALVDGVVGAVAIAGAGEMVFCVSLLSIRLLLPLPLAVADALALLVVAVAVAVAVACVILSILFLTRLAEKFSIFEGWSVPVWFCEGGSQDPENDSKKL